ncbi:uncharacterized protein LOC141907621 [Tubulanus polymorphus]|uniref:uncharacterized protein LOC141907621 n=1 Tax=Tubulanus polymorphus TaxID=672921 RepID=UPI003DA59EC1
MDAPTTKTPHQNLDFEDFGPINEIQYLEQFTQSVLKRECDDTSSPYNDTIATQQSFNYSPDPGVGIPQNLVKHETQPFNACQFKAPTPGSVSDLSCPGSAEAPTSLDLSATGGQSSIPPRSPAFSHPQNSDSPHPITSSSPHDVYQAYQSTVAPPVAAAPPAVTSQSYEPYTPAPPQSNHRNGAPDIYSTAAPPTGPPPSLPQALTADIYNHAPAYFESQVRSAAAAAGVYHQNHSLHPEFKSEYGNSYQGFTSSNCGMYQAALPGWGYPTDNHHHPHPYAGAYPPDAHSPHMPIPHRASMKREFSAAALPGISSFGGYGVPDRTWSYPPMNYQPVDYYGLDDNEEGTKKKAKKRKLEWGENCNITVNGEVSLDYHFDPASGGYVPGFVPPVYRRFTDFSGPICEIFLKIEKSLGDVLSTMRFRDPITHIYNPFDYAFETHSDYVRKYCNGRKTVLFLGMNPGPFGMSQTGIPFGEVSIVQNWLGVQGTIRKPTREHPKRPVKGFECERTEVSGSRFWGFFQKTCVTAENFFKHCFVHNHCPFAFMTASGKNVTPAQMPKTDSRHLMEACDVALCDVVRLLQVQHIIAVGKYAEERAQLALKNDGLEHVQVDALMHPSPINPIANKGWEEIARKQLIDYGVYQYLVAHDDCNGSRAAAIASTSSQHPQHPGAAQQQQHHHQQ